MAGLGENVARLAKKLRCVEQKLADARMKVAKTITRLRLERRNAYDEQEKARNDAGDAKVQIGVAKSRVVVSGSWPSWDGKGENMS